MNSQTSDRVSSIAGKYVALTPDQLLAMTALEKGRIDLARDIRSMAASLLRQDEVKGLRGVPKRLLRLVTG